MLIQWARANPQGWEERDISRVQDWRALPSKPQPTSQSQSVDDQPGWINAMNIQGVLFTKADRYSVQGLPGGGLQVWMWYDSPNDYPPGERCGAIWTFRDPAPDPEFGGAINTRQSCQWYAEPGSVVAQNMDAADPPIPYLPWTQFPVPPANTHRFGKWLTYEKFDQHVQRILPPPGWREWIS